ncbi:hypothetical protein ccbrp13_67820 [Ktedonobacteria bacterium brp13]|nr:hypothetical protein ccbrp13_67820 [Ktedonobacteria bacterium brp13]
MWEREQKEASAGHIQQPSVQVHSFGAKECEPFVWQVSWLLVQTLCKQSSHPAPLKRTQDSDIQQWRKAATTHQLQ